MGDLGGEPLQLQGGFCVVERGDGLRLPG